MKGKETLEWRTKCVKKPYVLCTNVPSSNSRTFASVEEGVPPIDEAEEAALKTKSSGWPLYISPSYEPDNL